MKGLAETIVCYSTSSLQKSETVWDDKVAQKVKVLAAEAIGQYWIPGIHGGRRQIAPASCPVTFTLMLWCVYNCTRAHTHKRDRNKDTYIHTGTLLTD